MGWRKDREDQLSAELAEHLRCGNTHMAFDPYYRGVVDRSYNRGTSFRDHAEENLKSRTSNVSDDSSNRSPHDR